MVSDVPWMSSWEGLQWLPPFRPWAALCFVMGFVCEAHELACVEHKCTQAVHLVYGKWIQRCGLCEYRVQAKKNFVLGFPPVSLSNTLLVVSSLSRLFATSR